MKIKILICLLIIVNYSIAGDKKDTVSLYSAPTITNHSITIGNKIIEYTATTGYLELLDEQGKHKANVFYISYMKKDETPNRPITFCFNGGPGSSSLWLHIGALGPRRILMTDEGNATPPPYQMVDNEYTWLEKTDLVFIDPVGTGFSRPIDGEKADQFYGYEKDIKAVGEFIRLFVNKNNRWGSKKYLAGESYGTTRASGLSKYLQEEHGMYLNGVILISCALNFETLREFHGNDLPYICNLPVYAAVAQYHNLLKGTNGKSPEKAISEAETFAMNDYALALLQGDNLDLEKKYALAKQMSELIGISTDYIYESNLRIPTYRFRKALLQDDNMNIGRFDARLKILDDDPIRSYGVNDASFTQIKGAFGTCINNYVRNELKYQNDLPYKIIGSVRPWEYADGKYLDVTSDLKQAMTINPNLKIWVASGYYDLATSYFGTNYAISHMNLPEFLKQNITTTYYEAGHMMYLHKESLIKLKKDADNFFEMK